MGVTDRYENQAFGFGCKILALQCHPEGTPAQADEWTELMGAEIKRSKIVGSAEELRAQNAQYVDTMNTQAKIFFEEWLETVGL